MNKFTTIVNCCTFRILRLRDAITFDDPFNITTSSSQLNQRIIDQQLYTILSECSSDAVVLVNQPGIVSSDFLFNSDTSLLWTQLIKYLRRSGTLLPYLQTSSPLDFSKISSYYTKKCRADLVHANGKFEIENPTEKLKELIAEGDEQGIEEFRNQHKNKGGPQMGPVGGNLGGRVGRLHNAKQYQDAGPLEPYIDTRKRVIRVEFPEIPVPDGSRSTFEARRTALLKHDTILSKIIDVIPSPMVTIIYTSTKPEYSEVSYNESGPYHDYLLIEDMLRFTQRPENRDLWKLHANYQHQKSIDAEEEDAEDDFFLDTDDEDQIRQRKEEWRQRKKEMMEEKGFTHDREDLFQKKKMPLMEERRLAERYRLQEASKKRKARKEDSWVERLDRYLSTEMILVIAALCILSVVVYTFVKAIVWVLGLVLGKSQKPEIGEPKPKETTIGMQSDKVSGISALASAVERRKVH